jgi:replicative DNA helicase
MILAARPSMGKTAIAINLAENICFRNHIPVGFFSLEMSATQILHRIISSQAEVESEKIQTGSLTGSEYQRIVGAVNMMQKDMMIIDDQPGLKITDIRARARRMKEAFNIGFIVIDYLQLISGSGNGRNIENRQTEISEISRMLKNLARELNIPILCAAQLSRKVEERQGHRPMMSDLRESGSLEQDADVVMMLFRRDYYDKYDKPGMAEVIVAKNRHGPVGDVQLAFRKEIGQFANYSPVHGQMDVAKGNKEAFSAFSPDDH